MDRIADHLIHEKNTSSRKRMFDAPGPSMNHAQFARADPRLKYQSRSDVPSTFYLDGYAAGRGSRGQRIGIKRRRRQSPHDLTKQHVPSHYPSLERDTECPSL